MRGVRPFQLQYTYDWHIQSHLVMEIGWSAKEEFASQKCPLYAKPRCKRLVMLCPSSQQDTHSNRENRSLFENAIAVKFVTSIYLKPKPTRRNMRFDELWFRLLQEQKRHISFGCYSDEPETCTRKAIIDAFSALLLRNRLELINWWWRYQGT